MKHFGGRKTRTADSKVQQEMKGGFFQHGVRPVAMSR
jgi:hypothetical protein